MGKCEESRKCRSEERSLAHDWSGIEGEGEGREAEGNRKLDEGYEAEERKTQTRWTTTGVGSSKVDDDGSTDPATEWRTGSGRLLKVKAATCSLSA